MKFSQKIIFFCDLTISIVFLFGSLIMLCQNHRNLLHTTIDQLINNHQLEAFSIESKLIQDSMNAITEFGAKTDKMNQQAITYVKQNANVVQGAYYALYNQDHAPLYSNMEQSLLDKNHTSEINGYRIISDHHRNIVLMSSHMKAGNMTYTITSGYDITSCYEERTRQFHSFLLIDACILLISFLILKIIVHYISAPIQKLNEVSRHIAQGNYEERTNIIADDEIGELSKSFDEMADAIETNINQLKQYAASREEFMGSFSHEIKTPMTAILGFADMLRTMDCDQETRHMAASYIYTEGKRLEHLSYTLMDLLALNEAEPKLSGISVTSVIDALKKYDQGSEKSCRLQFLCEHGTVQSHPELLFTLLRNLIDNAIKASSQDQLVLIKGVCYGDMYQFSIIDEGIGMSEKDIEMATQPFYMADKSRSRQCGGAGLGLSIVQRILELHQSKLIITSAPLKGTTVSFSLEVMHDEA